MSKLMTCSKCGTKATKFYFRQSNTICDECLGGRKDENPVALENVEHFALEERYARKNKPTNRITLQGMHNR